jgi:hypothetical protein
MLSGFFFMITRGAALGIFVVILVHKPAKRSHMIQVLDEGDLVPAESIEGQSTCLPIYIIPCLIRPTEFLLEFC